MTSPPSSDTGDGALSELPPERLRRWWWPTVVWLGATIAGTLVMRWGLPGARSGNDVGWTVPSDLVRLIAAAGSIHGHSGFSHLYGFEKPNTPFSTPPGFLLPLAGLLQLVGLVGIHPMLGGQVGLIPLGGGWEIVLPAVVGSGLLGVFSFTSLARRMGIGGWRLGVSTGAAAGALWWTTTWWGHPDDALAVSLLAAAAVTVLDGKWSAGAWLVGAGCAVQPVVLLALPVLLTLVALRHWVSFVARSVLPAAVLLVVPLIGDFHDTVAQVFGQPLAPKMPANHVTPWFWLAPVVGYYRSGSSVRWVAFVLAAGLALWLAHRRSGDAIAVVWAIGAALDLRCVFDAVIVPYYLLSGLVFGIVAAAGRPSWRLLGATVSAAVTLEISGSPALGVWGYFTAMVLGLGAVAAFAFPRRRGDRAADPDPAPAFL